MIDLKRILFPTDFSPYADEAKRYACALTEQFDAELHLLHVVHDVAQMVPGMGGGLVFPGYLEHLPAQMETMENEAIKQLNTILPDDWRQGKDIVVGVRRGVPFLEIVRYAKDQQIDLIVIGTHGRSGLAHALMGSVAEKIVQKAPCPVLTIRPEQHEFVMP